MHKQRMISTKFWSDNWVRENLNQLDRYLFLYFLTNEHTRICGIYELPLSTMAFETGFSRNELEDTMLKRLEPKIHYHDGWVIMPNFPKHQQANSPKIKIGIANELKTLSDEIYDQAIGYGYPMHDLSHITEDNNKITITKIPDWMDKDSWDSWEKHRKEIKKPLTDSTRILQISFLEKNKEDHINVINQSIQNGWTGLFPIKGQTNKEQQVYKSNK